MFEATKKSAEIFSAIDMLFGDLPLSYWACINSNEAPWTLFKEVQKSLDGNKKEEAIATLKEIINMPGLESRQYNTCRLIFSLTNSNKPKKGI